MRSAIRVRQQILLGLGGGLALAAGVACGGAVVPSDADGSTPGTGGTGGAATSGGGATAGAGGSGGSGASSGTGGADPTGGGTTGGTTGTGGTSGTTGSGGSSGGTTTGTGGGSTTTTGTGGVGGTIGSGGSGGGTTTTTGTGGGSTTTTTGTGGGSTTTTGTGGGSTTTTTGTGGVGGTIGTGGTGGGTTTTTGTGGATGGTGGIGGTGGTGGTGTTGCPADAGSREPICGDGGVGSPPGTNSRVCFSGAGIAHLLIFPVDGGELCALPNPCPTENFRTTFACGQFFYTWLPVRENGQCCYPLPGPAVDGRPFIVDGRARHADVIERTEWCDGQRFDARDERSDGGGGPCDRSEDRLTPAERARLAEAWLADAKAEHASIASFARLTLQLLSLGAPPELLIATQRATEDEILHAQLCFALASRFAGRALGPSELPMVGAVSDVSLAELAVAAVHEGCVGEATAAVLAGERLEQARDPQVRAALAKISADEARHAELAWRTVVWAIERGGQGVYAAVRAAFDEALAPYRGHASVHDGEDVDDELLAHGRVSTATIRRIQEVVAREVVEPIASSLTTLLSPAAAVPSRRLGYVEPGVGE